MSFKNALTKLGLVEEDVTKKAQVATKPAAPAPLPTYTANGGTPISAPSSPIYSPSSSYAPTPTIDPEIGAMLAQSLQDAKLSGFDYMKFTSSVEETKAFGVPEDARYKMAFSTAKQLGVDKASLVKSGEHYLEVLKQDESDFGANCAQYEKKEIQARADKIKQIEDSINDTANKLTHLQQDHETLTKELQDETAKLESKRSSFQVTLQSFRSAIETNIQKINQYLQ